MAKLALEARRAYQFAKHTMSHVGQDMAAENEGGPKYLEENMRCIPDMPELPKEQDYGNGNSVVHPVPPIEAWNELTARVEKISSDHPYIDVAMNILSEMRKYVGYSYAVGFQVPVDVVRLAIAIERFVKPSKEQEPSMLIMGEHIAANETVTFPDDPNRQPRRISVTLDNGDIFEGIVHYAGNAKEQE